MKKILTAILAGTLSISMLLGGCQSGGGSQASSAGGSGGSSGGSSSGGDVELRFSWWGSEDRHAAFEKAVELYTAANPNVSIKVEYGAWDGWQQNILTQLGGNTEADILQVNYSWVHSFGKGSNVFLDLNTMSDHIDLGNWDSEYLDAMTVGGELGAVPHGMNGRVMVYNKPLFEEAGLDFPATYADVMAAGAVIGADNTPTGAENKYVLQLLDPATPDLFIAQMLYNKTGRIMQVDGQVQYSIEEVAEVLEEYEAFAEANAMETFHQKDSMDNESNPVWTSGRSGSIYEWCSSINKYAGSYKGGDAVDELGVAPYIVPQDGVNPTIYVKPNLGYAISKNSKNPEVAADFLNFFFTDEECVKALGTSIGISSNSVTKGIQEANGMLEGITKEGYDMLGSYPQMVMDPYFEDANVRGERYTAVESFRSGQSTALEAATSYVERQQAELDKVYK